jgi:hypothetical protein
MTNEGRITVYSARFSVPGSIVATGLGTVRIAYYAPGDNDRVDWFYSLDGERRPGERMGDHDPDIVRYSVTQDEGA